MLSCDHCQHGWVKPEPSPGGGYAVRCVMCSAGGPVLATAEAALLQWTLRHAPETARDVAGGTDRPSPGPTPRRGRGRGGT